MGSTSKRRGKKEKKQTKSGAERRGKWEGREEGRRKRDILPPLAEA